VLGKALGGLLGLVLLACVAATAHAAYPGANGKIVFERKPDQFTPKNAPWTVNAGDPASASRLAKLNESSYNSVYSPNGKKIAFQATVPSEEIVVMKANGRNPQIITKRIDKCIGKQHPTWSPDGKKLAFVCLNSRGFNQHDVWSVNVDGSGVKQISKTHDAEIPAWSPLGDEIAYSGGGTIYTVPASGGDSTILNDDPPFIASTWDAIDWAPNGQTLLAEASGDGIYTLNATTGLVTSADLADSGSEPVFSPDGTKILYVNNAGQSAGRLQIWMMDATGLNKQPVTTGGYDRAPNWGVAP
jgi:Tol biopolymer transport system component